MGSPKPSPKGSRVPPGEPHKTWVAAVALPVWFLQEPTLKTPGVANLGRTAWSQQWIRLVAPQELLLQLSLGGGLPPRDLTRSLKGLGLHSALSPGQKRRGPGKGPCQVAKPGAR